MYIKLRKTKIKYLLQQGMENVQKQRIITDSFQLVLFKRAYLLWSSDISCNWETVVEYIS